jgi:hypothetical protein
MGGVIIGVSFLGGAALGPRWNVFVLVPVIALVAVCALGVGVRSDYHGWSLALLVLTAGAAVQIGYFVGGITAATWAMRRRRGESRDVLTSSGSAATPARHSRRSVIATGAIATGGGKR